jgi:hypothetical protein
VSVVREFCTEIDHLVVTFDQQFSSQFEVAIRKALVIVGCRVCVVKGKAIPLQALTGPEGSRRLRLPDFKTIGT